MAVFSKKRPSNLRLIINQLVERVNNDAKRIRVLEQRNGVIESRLNSIEQTLTGNYKEFIKVMKLQEKSIAGLGDKIMETERKISEIIRQFKRVATKAEVKTLQNLLEIYNPIKSNFVTREELKDLQKGKNV